jgi:hypothetical protein
VGPLSLIDFSLFGVRNVDDQEKLPIGEPSLPGRTTSLTQKVENKLLTPTGLPMTLRKCQ